MSPIRKRSEKAGAPPGTLAYLGDAPTTQPITVTLFQYDERELSERTLADPAEAFPLPEEPTVSWLNLDGVHRVELIEQIGRALSLHPLLLEDLVNTQQRPKMEDYGAYLFIVARMLDYDPERRHIHSEQVALVLGREYLVSFEEDPGDVFNPVRARLRSGAPRLRKGGPDYLAYALLDAVVDGYFHILEQVGEVIADLEEELVSHPTQETLQGIYRLKREMIALRRAVWPLRDVINSLLHSESELIQSSTKVYLRDVYDHTIQIVDAVESIRDLLAGMLDIYLSGTSNRLNEIMKVLTIFSTLFIPLTFLAGVYGMNFEYFPELKWWFGYPMFWGISLTIALTMLAFFRRRGWM
ncbi:MAG: magnesium/cobalt transporter CorA [Anaerolineae bacterium]|nr:magnesium/cobalt transporter CorA [Anaerolineae bacterium]